MAPLPVIPNTMRVAFEWSSNTVAGFNATNVMHFSTAKDADEVGEDLIGTIGDFGVGMWACVSGVYSLTKMVLTPLDGTTASYEVNTTGVTGFGGGAGADFVPQACGLIKFTTATRGRSARGRIYLPFVGEDVQQAGALDGPTVTALQEGWDSFLDGMTILACLPVIASYKLEETFGITNHVAEESIATQRRRNRRPY